MENVNIDWSDPIFGEVTEKQRDWYLKESGTYWNNSRQKWYVRGLAKETREVTRFKKDSTRFTDIVTVLRADNFQEEMLKQKQFIRDHMPAGEYVITNGNAFDLMRGFETVVPYEYQGQHFLETLKLF